MSLITAGLVGAIVFSFALGVLYEGFKTAKDIITKRAQTFDLPPRHHSLSESGSDLHTFIPHRYNIYIIIKKQLSWFIVDLYALPLSLPYDLLV